MVQQTSVIDRIENDEFLKNFLHADATSQSATAQSLSFPDQIKKLTDGLDLISIELKQKIRHDYPNLIKHSANASKLMVALESLDDDLTQLHTSVNNLKKNVYVPYEKLERQIVTCERLYNASQLMRKVQRFLQLHRKLKETSELNKQALIVHELDGLVNDQELMKINMLIDERAAVVNVKQKLLHIANRDLTKGIQDVDEASIMKSLEIYRNLDILGSFLDNQIDSYLNDVRQSLKQCFNGADLATLQKTSIKGSPTTSVGPAKSAKLPGRVPQLTTSMNFKAKLLAGLEWLLTDEIVAISEQIIAIDGCLKKITSGYITENPGKDFMRKFSRKLCDLLQISFEESPVHVLQNLQQSLPKILAFFNGLQSRVGGSKEMELDKSIFGSLKSGYIEKCAANLKIAAHEQITEEVIEQMVKNATTELTVSLIDDDLLSSVVGVLCACNQDLANKIKSTIRSDADQVLTIPNANQMHNISIANLVYQHQLRMEEMLIGLDLEKHDKIAYEKLRKSIDDCRKVTTLILQQLLKQIMSNISNILLSMHREPSLNSDNINVPAASLYMREFQDFLNRSWSCHMVPFNDKIAVAKIAEELAVKSIELFIQNLSILRPISSKGRQRIKSDCLHLENLLATILSDMSAIGNSYRMLRMIATFVVEVPEKLVEVENNLIPSYVILFMLFGHAAEDLKSPHKAAGWSDEKLIGWLGEHKDHRERLELISGALLKYRNYIREKNKSQYDPVYPLISKMLEKALVPYQKAPVRGLL